MSGPGTPGKDQWKPDELKLRKREVTYSLAGLVTQALLTCFALAATLAAGYAAVQAARAVDVAAKGMKLQANANRLSTAISAMGGDHAAERVGGFALLRRHVETQVETADAPEDRLDAYNLYTTATEVLVNYLHTPVEASTKAAKEPTAGLGFGRPEVPYDNKYAARALQSLMTLKPKIMELHSSLGVKLPGPKVDLSNVQLYEQSWEGIDFAWLAGHFFPNIDLRGANLKDSIWGASLLDGAHLQCANLEGANLRGASLIGADLRGAHLYHADFTGAKLDKVNLDGASFVKEAKGLESFQPKPGVSRAKDGIGNDGIEECLNSEYSKRS